MTSNCSRVGGSPISRLDVVAMIHNIRNKTCDIREYSVGGYGVCEVVEENYSLFAAKIMAQSYTRNFKLPNLTPNDGKFDPAYHVQHYATWITI